MARTWWSIEVQLVSGRGAYLWPRPGRVLIARPGWTFRVLAQAINDAFARWDLSHLHQFVLADGTRIAMPDPWGEDDAVDDTQAKLSRLAAGEVFAYTFDFGDGWDHVCTVAPQKVDPLEVAGVVPDRPIPVFGWGLLPDQYERRFAGDDGEGPPPQQPDPPASDLPPVLHDWGPGDHVSGTGAATGQAVTATPEGWDEAAVRSLRVAVHTGDLDAAAALLRRHDASQVPHLAAPALIGLARRGGYDVIPAMIQHLTRRAWPGDAELAAQLRAAGGEGPPPAGVPIAVDLAALAEHLERHGHDDLAPWYLDVITGAWVTSEPMAGVDDPPPDLDDDERYLPLTPHGRDEGWHDMELFIQTVADDQLAERLYRAIRGRGAFRHFGDVLHHDDAQWQRWRRFSEERHLGRARQWLARRDLRPEH